MYTTKMRRDISSIPPSMHSGTFPFNSSLIHRGAIAAFFRRGGG